MSNAFHPQDQTRFDAALRLAARCQHLCRWMSPRDSYPMTYTRYLRWREDFKELHAQKAATQIERILSKAKIMPGQDCEIDAAGE